MFTMFRRARRKTTHTAALSRIQARGGAVHGQDKPGKGLAEQRQAPVREQDGAVLGRGGKASCPMRLDMHEAGRPVVAQRSPAKEGAVQIRVPADAQFLAARPLRQADKAGELFFGAASQGAVEGFQTVIEGIAAKEVVGSLHRTGLKTAEQELQLLRAAGGAAVADIFAGDGDRPRRDAPFKYVRQIFPEEAARLAGPVKDRLPQAAQFRELAPLALGKTGRHGGGDQGVLHPHLQGDALLLRADFCVQAASQGAEHAGILAREPDDAFPVCRQCFAEGAARRRIVLASAPERQEHQARYAEHAADDIPPPRVALVFGHIIIKSHGGVLVIIQRHGDAREGQEECGRRHEPAVMAGQDGVADAFGTDGIAVGHRPILVYIHHARLGHREDVRLIFIGHAEPHDQSHEDARQGHPPHQLAVQPDIRPPLGIYFFDFYLHRQPLNRCKSNAFFVISVYFSP